MRTITARTSHENSSCSKRNFKWIIRKGGRGGDSGRKQWEEEEEEKEIPSFSASSFSHAETATCGVFRKKSSAAAVAVSRFRSVLTAALTSSRQNRSVARMTGTLYGNRCGHVHLAFQVDSRACPVVLLELAMLTSVLVREMASGLVRIALECQRNKAGSGKGREAKKLMEESLWRAYCNGRKCGYALRRECRPADWKVLKAVEPVSMGAGVLPVDNAGEGPDGEMMYMRATFERVTGSKDSEAFYMMNPDSSNGGTELSIYFLRV